VPNLAATNKKWMQQYRQCACYFNKLSKNDLLVFVANTCFTRDAIDRVPAGTRNLMIMQAVDYCQQEQENDFKFNKNACSDPSWAQVGQELTRWARFLENYYSSTIQGIIDTSGVPHDEIWPEIEMSHGDPDTIVLCASQLVMQGDMRASALTTVLQCLNVDARPEHVFRCIAENVYSADDIQKLVTRLTQYHNDGVKFSDDLLERIMQKATECGLPPHKQISLLSLSQKTQMHDSSDLMKIAQFTADLLRAEWPDSGCAASLTDEKLLSEEGRREMFAAFSQDADSWQRKKALVDVLVCWPPTRDGETRSLHCEYLQSLLTPSADHKENLVLIKLLLRRPLLNQEEVQYLVENAPKEAAINAIWIVLLSNDEHDKEHILDLIARHK
ncbi:uncharacterized protein LOC113234295, partial [Hyposmocoma kahamanoa]|uniref:uncharacterized protein LOC113234295 n=1 Tax=Hyposmocoma kahamanoa TaxID=1477025 RepID=UPI000E6D89F5